MNDKSQTVKDASQYLDGSTLQETCVVSVWMHGDADVSTSKAACIDTAQRAPNAANTICSVSAMKRPAKRKSSQARANDSSPSRENACQSVQETSIPPYSWKIQIISWIAAELHSVNMGTSNGTSSTS